jgi:hypothetical protein
MMKFSWQQFHPQIRSKSVRDRISFISLGAVTHWRTPKIETIRLGFNEKWIPVEPESASVGRVHLSLSQSAWTDVCRMGVGRENSRHEIVGGWLTDRLESNSEK